MMDFVKRYPSITVEDYFWRYSAAKIKLMSSDGTYQAYLSEKQATTYWAKHPKKGKIYEDPNAFINDLGLPML